MSEATEQMALIEFAERFSGRVPELARLMHIPNGGKRSKGVAGQFKAMGVRAGVPDLFLPVVRGSCAGLWIELKAGKGKPSAEQREWLAYLQAAGYATQVCWGWPAAATVLLEYLGYSPAAFGLDALARGAGREG